MKQQAQIAALTGQAVRRFSRLSGGMIGDVFKVELADGTFVVAKVSDADGTLDIEGEMLRYLFAHSELPLPQVLHAEPHLLLMNHIANQGGINRPVEEHAATLLAKLHSVQAQQYGLAFDTLIGPLHQPNPLMHSWIAFFREHRLLYMADIAYESGHFSLAMRKRVDQLAAKLDDLLHEPPHPSLIHGDMWGGNVLVRNGQVAAFIDPAIYYADAEIELAYSTLFGTFGEAFFATYQAIRPLQPGFFETRRYIYNLYHLLVHVALFGGGYAHQTDTIVRRFL